jgi:hypothetical protein
MEEKVDNRPATKTWFFETSDGKIFPAEEKEAFELMTNKSQWRRHDLKLIGVSDGTAYNSVIDGAGDKVRETKEQMLEMKKTLKKYEAGLEKLLFEEFAEEDDPRVLRAKKLIEDTEAKLAPLQKEIEDYTVNIRQKAFDAELEQARGNIENPRDFSVIMQGAESAAHKQALEGFANAKRVI